MRKPQLLLFSATTIILLFSACTQIQVEQTFNKNCTTLKVPKPTKALLTYFSKTDKPIMNHSAFYPLALPQDALAARLFLIDNAQYTLDVQYYIYEDDTIGNIFSYHLLKAAQRGVKVRILLDDISTTGKDKNIMTLAQHPNIELKLFNPNSFRKAFRNLALLFDINTLGKRMHNKALIADASAAIIGGRNIGNVYYTSNSETLFLDYDILVIGGVLPQLTDSFNLYWNATEAVSSNKLLDTQEKFSIKEAKCFIQQQSANFDKSPAGKIVKNAPFSQALAKQKLLFTVAEKTNLFYDLPSKVSTDENINSNHISQQISEDLKEVQHELLIISPYFIPSDTLMQRFKTLREKGIRIIVITNSLASTDVFAVYGGYFDYIKPLVKMGVELYELKPTILPNLTKNVKIKKPPLLSLHTKLILSDKKRLAIGSANIDPRSEKLNTELVMIITSKQLATHEEKYIKSMLSLKNFYKLSWGEQPKGVYDDGLTHYGPIWKTLENGEVKLYYSPPEASFWKRLGAGVVRILPIKGYL